MDKDFYKKFEDEFRGSEEVIQSRLSPYASIVKYVAEQHQGRIALDLGCGRGEWLKFCKTYGLDVKGVDLDQGMIEEAQQQGFDVELTDALEFLKETESDSIGLLTSFHMVEHLSIVRVFELIKEAHRVLAPGGVLLIETPNAESLIVGTNNFYIDPTHIKPIPNQLLNFIVQYSGFSESQVIRMNSGATQVNNLLEAVLSTSMDYSVVAIKSSDNDVKVEHIYDGEYGVSLTDAVHSYDLTQEKIKGDLAVLRGELNQYKNELIQLRAELHGTVEKRMKRIIKKVLKKIIFSHPKIESLARKFLKNDIPRKDFPLSEKANSIYERLKK